MNSRLKLSVVTACFNSASTIAETLASVQAQAEVDVEHIVVDGGSKDGTNEIIARYARPSLVAISEPDDGIYDAMNKGISMATGDVIALLNSDDAYAHDRVGVRALDAIASTGADAAFGDIAMFARNFDQAPFRRYHSDIYRPSRLRFGIMPAHPAMFVRREVYERYGCYATDYRIAADFEFVARAFGQGGSSFVHCPDVWVNMRAGGASTRDLAARMTINRETVRACRDNGIRTNLALLLLKYPLKLRGLSIRNGARE